MTSSSIHDSGSAAARLLCSTLDMLFGLHDCMYSSPGSYSILHPQSNNPGLNPAHNASTLLGSTLQHKNISWLLDDWRFAGSDLVEPVYVAPLEPLEPHVFSSNERYFFYIILSQSLY